MKRTNKNRQAEYLQTGKSERTAYYIGNSQENNVQPEKEIGSV